MARKKRINFSSARKTYEKKTKEQRAVAIAKDVIRILNETNRLLVTGSVFMSNTPDVTDRSKDARTVLRKHTDKNSCFVCAKGALLFTKVMARDKLLVSDIDTCFLSRRNLMSTKNQVIVNHLADAFDQSTLDLIEIAFEGIVPSYSVHLNLYGTGVAPRWSYRYAYKHERLVAIMQRVIDNGGTFGLEDLKNPPLNTGT